MPLGAASRHAAWNDSRACVDRDGAPAGQGGQEDSNDPKGVGVCTRGGPLSERQTRGDYRRGWAQLRRVHRPNSGRPHALSRRERHYAVVRSAENAAGTMGPAAGRGGQRRHSGSHSGPLGRDSGISGTQQLTADPRDQTARPQRCGKSNAAGRSGSGKARRGHRCSARCVRECDDSASRAEPSERHAKRQKARAAGYTGARTKRSAGRCRRDRPKNLACCPRS